jgi:hypothetical protein
LKERKKGRKEGRKEEKNEGMKKGRKERKPETGEPGPSAAWGPGEPTEDRTPEPF